MAESRRHSRLKAPTISLRVSAEDNFRKRYVKDLSQGGVFIRTREVDPVGSQIRLELTPPGWSRPLLLQGLVIRHAMAEEDGEHYPVGMGIKFVDVGPMNRELLAEVLSEYEAKAPAFEFEDDIESMDPTRMRRELLLLRTCFEESQKQVAALHEEIEAHEEEEAAKGAVIERLLREKHEAGAQDANGALAEARTLITSLTEENARLSQQLHQTIQAAERSRADFVELHADIGRVIEQEQAKALEKIETVSKDSEVTVTTLRERLESTEGRYQRLQKQQRKLRRLVSLISAADPTATPNLAQEALQAIEDD